MWTRYAISIFFLNISLLHYMHKIRLKIIFTSSKVQIVQPIIGLTCKIHHVPDLIYISSTDTYKLDLFITNLIINRDDCNHIMRINPATH